MKRITLFIMILVIFLVSSGQTREIPFTQDDRDRLIRLETKIEEGLKGTNQRIEDLKKELKGDISDLKTFMLWGFGILFGGMGILIGFVIWDRRTALSPAIKKYKELEEREEKLERVFKELSTKDQNIAEALRHVGLL